MRPATLVHICDECNFGSYGGRCIVCGYHGVSDAYYCAECTLLEKDRDGYPKTANMGISRLDNIFNSRQQQSSFQRG